MGKARSTGAQESSTRQRDGETAASLPRPGGAETRAPRRRAKTPAQAILQQLDDAERALALDASEGPALRALEALHKARQWITGLAKGETGVPSLTKGETGVPGLTKSETGVPSLTKGETGVPGLTKSETGVPRLTKGETGVPSIGEAESGGPVPSFLEQVMQVVGQAPFFVIAVAPNGRPLAANRTLLEALGLSLEELLHAQDVSAFLLPQDWDDVRALMPKVMAGQVPTDLTVRLPIFAKDGSRREMTWFGSVVPASDGGPEMLLGYGEDVTARRVAEAALADSEARFRGIFDQSPVGIALFDSTGHLMTLNPACLQVFGIPSAGAASGLDLLGHALVTRHMAELMRIRQTVRRDWRIDFDEIRREGLYDTTRTGEAELEAVVTPLNPTADGTVNGFLLQVQEVTEPRRQVAALRESEEMYHSVVDTSPDAIFLLDTNLRIRDASLRAAELLRALSPKELLGRQWFDFLAPVERARAQLDLNPLLTRGSSRQVEYRMVHLDGKEFTAEVSSTVLREPSGAPRGIVTSVRDVTEPRRLAESLRRRAEELAALQAIVLDLTTARELPSLLQTIVERAASLLKSPHGLLYLIDENGAALRCGVVHNLPDRMLGRVLASGEGLTGMVAQSGHAQIVNDYSHWQGRLASHADEPPEIQHAFGSVVSAPLLWRGRVTGVITILEDEGSRHFANEDLELLQLFAGHAAIAVENTRLYQEAQQRVRELEAINRTIAGLGATLDLDRTLQRIVEAAVEAIPAAEGGSLHLMDDAQGELTIRASVGLNTHTVRSARFRPGQGLAGWCLSQRKGAVVPDWSADPHVVCTAGDAERHPARSAICVPLLTDAEAIGVLTLDNLSQRQAFSQRDLSLLSAFAAQAAVAIQNASLYSAARREIREREIVETQLVQSTAQYRTTIEAMQDAVLVVDRDGKIVLYNGMFETWIRALHPDGELDWTGVKDLSPQPPDELRKQYEEVFTTGKPLQSVIHFSHGDAQYTVEMRTVPVMEGEQVARVVVVMHDISERHRQELERQELEAQLRQAQKMEAIGLLAGGVAHDFNNLLTVMLGNAELALTQPGRPFPERELNTICKASRQAATLTRQLLAFSRRQTVIRQNVDVNALLLEFGGMLERLLGPGIELRVQPAPGLPCIQGDPIALQQVLTNLAMNSRDAMPNGGLLQLEVAQVTIAEGRAPGRTAARPGEFVRIAVVDTGIGMAPGVQEHLFEPFYTTKEVGKGTGLGLPVAYGIVQQHGGWIEATSEVGKGTRMDVYLPIETKGAPEALATVTVQPTTGLVLVVDDEADVREPTRRHLEDLGYAAITVSSGRAALRELTVQAERFALVVLDAGMPEMSGQETLAAIRRLGVTLPVVLLVGPSEDKERGADADGERVARLAKPFTVDQLQHAVRSALKK